MDYYQECQKIKGARVRITAKDNIGNVIESLFNADISPNSQADLIDWELKSKRIGAKSPMTLGSKLTNSGMTALINQVYSKCKSVILLEYNQYPDYITIESITFFSGMTIEKLQSAVYNHNVITERRGEFTTLRVHRWNFIKLYSTIRIVR